MRGETYCWAHGTARNHLPWIDVGNSLRTLNLYLTMFDKSRFRICKGLNGFHAEPVDDIITYKTEEGCSTMTHRFARFGRIKLLI